MIVEEHSRSQSNMPSQAMGIANNSVVFDLLVNRLYSNKPLAILREYICNAYDAQVDNGNKDTPIAIHLPTRLESFFSIRDYGTGMSGSTVKDVFSTLGESTKRNSNEATGMLGIGSKSALTANDSFMVTSYYNGEKSVYSVFLDNGMPNISNFGSSPTTEANGLEVNVPIPSSWISDMQREAEKFLRYFSGKVKVNSELSLELGQVIYQGTGWKIYNNSNSPVVLMGNIPYPLDQRILEKLQTLSRTQGLVVEVPIGSVQFAASRETLSYTDSTIKTLTNINKIIEDELMVEVERITSKYKNNLFALSKALQALPYNIKNIVRSKINNENIRHDFNIQSDYFKFRAKNYRGKFSTVSSVGSSQENHLIILVDTPRAQEVALHHEDSKKTLLISLDVSQDSLGGKEQAKAKLKEFCDKLGVNYVIASEEYIRIFGTTVRTKTSKGIVANNLMYRATGITYKDGHISSMYNNHFEVSLKNREKTIGIPISSGQIMDSTYSKAMSQNLLSDIKRILPLLKDQDIQIVYIPKTHKAHLQNTQDVYQWLKSLELPEITHCETELKNKYAKDYFSTYEMRDMKLPQNLQRYIKEAYEIASHVDNSQYVQTAKSLGIPLKVKSVVESPWLKEAHIKYDPLKAVGNNLRYNKEHKERFEKLALIIEGCK